MSIGVIIIIALLALAIVSYAAKLLYNVVPAYMQDGIHDVEGFCKRAFAAVGIAGKMYGITNEGIAAEVAKKAATRFPKVNPLDIEVVIGKLLSDAEAIKEKDNVPCEGADVGTIPGSPGEM